MMPDPLSAGVPKVRLAVVFPPCTVSDVGAPGTVAGTTAADAPDTAPLPTALVA